MFFKKYIPIVLANQEQEKIEFEPKKNKPNKNKKIFILVILISLITYFANENKSLIISYFNQYKSNKIGDLLNETPPENTNNLEDENTKLPDVIIQRKNETLRKMMEEKEKEKQLNSLPVETKSESTQTITNEELPKIEFNSNQNSNSAEEKQNNVTQVENLPAVDKPTNLDETITLKKELGMILRDAKFSVNAKKENIDIYINNINHSKNQSILNNDKFFLSDVSMQCEDNKMPIFQFKISDKKNNTVLFEKKINYTEDKKVVLFFDALSITNKENNNEDIYFNGESVFKDFKLNKIDEQNGVLTFDFNCNDRNIKITGKELEEIK